MRTSRPRPHLSLLLPPQTAVVKEGVRSRSELDLPPPVLTVQDLAALLATSSRAVYKTISTVENGKNADFTTPCQRSPFAANPRCYLRIRP